MNDRGGIEADLTVTRIGENEFFIVTSATSQVRDFHWLKDHIPDEAHAFLTDITSAQAVLSIMGPKARDLLTTITNSDVSHNAFPFGQSKVIEIGNALVRATRLTYVGELGWELYIPIQQAKKIYHYLIKAGISYNLIHAGAHAMDIMRMEKMYLHWGHDISPAENPFEAGLGFAVNLKKEEEFIAYCSCVSDG